MKDAQITITISGPMACGKSWLAMLISDALENMGMTVTAEDKDMTPEQLARRREWLKDMEKSDRILDMLKTKKVHINQVQTRRQ